MFLLSGPRVNLSGDRVDHSVPHWNWIRNWKPPSPPQQQRIPTTCFSFYQRNWNRNYIDLEVELELGLLPHHTKRQLELAIELDLELDLELALVLELDLLPPT